MSKLDNEDGVGELHIDGQIVHGRSPVMTHCKRVN